MAGALHVFKKKKYSQCNLFTNLSLFMVNERSSHIKPDTIVLYKHFFVLFKKNLGNLLSFI